MKFKIILIFIIISVKLHSQCTIVSSCGYSVNLSIGKLAVVPSSTNCPFGFNYNISFSYSITVRGINTCYNSNIGIQPQIICGSHNNNYYTINVPAPTVGSPSTTTNFTGNLVTSSNPYIATATCNSATPANLNCNSQTLTMFGPNISGTFPCNIVALPIELVYFNSALATDAIVLFWATANEINNDFFTIEKSIDAINFYELEKVKGNSNSLVTKFYSLTDTNPYAGINYYRLKQTDYNNQFTYSAIVSQEYQEAINFSVYPNPVMQGNSLSINLVENYNTPLYLMVYDNFGQLILHKTIDAATHDEITLNDLQLAAGIYVIRLNTETKSSFLKLIIE